jgi:hypothetical protein
MIFWLAVNTLAGNCRHTAFSTKRYAVTGMGLGAAGETGISW